MKSYLIVISAELFNVRLYRTSDLWLFSINKPISPNRMHLIPKLKYNNFVTLTTATASRASQESPSLPSHSKSHTVLSKTLTLVATSYYHKRKRGPQTSFQQIGSATSISNTHGESVHIIRSTQMRSRTHRSSLTSIIAHSATICWWWFG